GNVGEPKVSLCTIRRRSADRNGEDSRRGEEAPASLTSLVRKGTQRKTRDAGYRGRRGSTERPREGPVAGSAEHSTAGWERCAPGREGGEPMSQGPTGGKAKPGSTVSGRTSGRDSGLTNRIHETPEHCPTGQALSGDGVQQRVLLD